MKKIVQSAFLALGALVILAKPALAFTIGPITVRGWGTDLGGLLSALLILIYAFAALLAFVFIVIGGMQWITAGGDKVAMQSARDRITAAVVGLVIVVAAFAITTIITTVLGINIFEGIEIPGPPNPTF